MKQIRRKFVLYAMLAVFVLLLTILAVINGTNFTMAADDADAVTARLAENKGKFGEPDAPPANFFNPGGFGPLGPDSPETDFSMRYFTVRFGKDDTVKLTVYQVAAVSEEEAVAWAESLMNEGKQNGGTGWTHGTYRYRVYKKGDSVYVTVIDQGRELTPSYRILVISLIGLGVGLVISFLFLTFISKRLFAPLEEADRKERQFLLEAEKEFKIPLTVIRADTELIERDHGPSDYTSSIHRQVSRMSDLTRSLGDLAIISDDSAPAGCRISDVFGQAAESAEKALAEAGIRLTEQYDKTITLPVSPELFRRVADELLENIGKFALTKAAVRTEKQANRVIVTLSNDCSLPDGPCDNVFDRFVRLSNADGKSGAGLGLSFVKDAVKQMGGRVSAAVKDGQFLLKLLL